MRSLKGVGESVVTIFPPSPFVSVAAADVCRQDALGGLSLVRLTRLCNSATLSGRENGICIPQ